MTRHPADDRAGPPSAAFRFLNEAPPPRLCWLWPQRLPLGCLTLLIGDPGVGKSLLTADLAARLSVPHPWPDNPAAERPDLATLPPLPSEPTDEAFYRSFPPIRGFPAREIAPTGVLFAAPEDHAALPDRLAAAGADLLRISVLDGVRPPFTDDLLPLRLPAHADQLEQAIRAHDYPRLVVLDPIHTLLDDGVYCSPDLQAGLVACLASLARRCGVALLAVGHLTRTYARRVLYRIRGSLSLVAAARSVLLLTADPDCPDRRILTQIKNAYGPLAPPLAFRIVSPPAVPALSHVPTFPPSDTPSNAIGQEQSLPNSLLATHHSLLSGASAPLRETPPGPRLAWDDPARPDWRLSTGVLDLSPESFSVLSDTCDWLTDFLSAGPRPAREVLAAARAAGIPRVTLFRAKRLLNIPSRKIGPAWTWFPAGEGFLPPLRPREGPGEGSAS